MNQIRWMIRRDMDAVLRIENQHDNPQTEEEIILALRQRNCIGKVYEFEEQIAGFMIYELHKDRYELLSLVVDQEYPLDTFGTKMVDYLAGKLSGEKKRHKICISITVDDLDGYLFLRSCGFAAISLNGDFNEYSMEYSRLPQVWLVSRNRIQNYMESSN